MDTTENTNQENEQKKVEETKATETPRESTETSAHKKVERYANAVAHRAARRQQGGGSRSIFSH